MGYLVVWATGTFAQLFKDVCLTVSVSHRSLSVSMLADQNSLSSRISSMVSPSVISPSLLDRLFLVRKSSPAVSHPFTL